MEFRAEGFKGQQLYRLPAGALRRVRAQPFTADFVVTDLGFFPRTGEHRVERTMPLRQHVLIYVDAGRGWAGPGGRRVELAEGQILLLPPGEPHSYGAHETDPWSIYWFHFEGRGAEDLLNWTGFEKRRRVLDCLSPAGMRRHFRTVLDAVERGYHEHTLLELSRALINVLALLHRNPLRRYRNPTFERIEEIMDAMRSQVNRPGTLRTYARQAGLSVAQFSHLFKQHAGISPMTYLNELRMQRACEYLDTSDLSVKEIAGKLGYQDPLYFSRAFSKCTGLAPTAYRDRA